MNVSRNLPPPSGDSVKGKEEIEKIAPPTKKNKKKDNHAKKVSESAHKSINDKQDKLTAAKSETDKPLEERTLNVKKQQDKVGSVASKEGSPLAKPAQNPTLGPVPVQIPASKTEQSSAQKGVPPTRQSSAQNTVPPSTQNTVPPPTQAPGAPASGQNQPPPIPPVNAQQSQGAAAGPQQVPPPPPPPPPPLVLEDEMMRIQQIADKASDTSDSSRIILKDFLSTFKKFPKEFEEPVVDAELEKNQNGQFNIEPFQLNDPSKTYYGIKVTYTVTVKYKDHSKPDKKLKFVRKISTNATNPEDAVIMASKFKHSVCEIAKNGAGMACENEFKGIDPEFETAKSFFFKFSYNADQRISNLLSLAVVVGEKKKEKSITTDQSKKYAYNPQTNDFYEAKTPLKEEDFAGRLMFDSEEEALMYTKGYHFVNDNLYDQLQKENRTADHVKTVMDDIQSQSKKYDELYATFIKQPYFKWLKRFWKVSQTPDTERIQLESDIYKDVKEGKGVSDKELKKLSPNMQNFVNLNKEIEEAKNNFKSTDKELNKDLNSLDQLSRKGAKLEDDEESDLKDLLKKYGTADDVLQDKKRTTQDFIELGKKAIEQARSNHLNEMALKDKDLKEIQRQIVGEQVGFNKRLGDMRKVNGEIRIKINQLKDLKNKAELVLAGNPTKDEANQARQLDKSIGNLKKLEDQYQANDREINQLIGNLKLVGADKSPPKELEASDG